MKRHIVLAFVLSFLLAASPRTLFAQWPKYTAAGVPTGADGKLDAKAVTPRAADGHPDLSGV